MKRRISTLLRYLQLRTEGTEIIEFAVSMPLLVILAVGIYDFGTAFTLKHKLNSAARDGTRIAASQHHPPDPSARERCNVPSSICTIRDIVASDLQTSIGNDCGLSTANGSYSAGTFSWTFTGSCSGFNLKIERAFLNPNLITLADPFDDGDAYQIENTRITLVYPYQWQFSKAFQLLGSDANFLKSTITVSCVMQNLD
jgi:hypothetical protein